MTRYTIKTALTRFVLIVGIAASIGVGSVGIGGTAEVAAYPRDCDRIFLHAANYWSLYQFWSAYGYVDLANHYRSLSDFYLDVGMVVC
jgi:hypothetical protein